jgi:predicted TIM-barrel fold metal-dependent hydrolase
MRLVERFGACDCHSHVFGPFNEFPLSSRRTFDPPESPIERLEEVWKTLGIERAVLVQGSANGNDHRALLAGLARFPDTRRGVALLEADVSDSEITALDAAGICAVRFNWIHHLLAGDGRCEEQRLREAARLLERVQALGWHVEIHIDVADLDLVSRLNVTTEMAVVIDHMARIDASAATSSVQISSLLNAIDRHAYWVKVSGGDRLTANCEDLSMAINPIRQIVKAVPERCVWGLDWPHVNLSRMRSDLELAELLLEAMGDERTLEQVLIHNPETLYGFDSGIH